MEDFGVRIDDKSKAIEIDMRKLWNNFLIVADFHLWEKHGVNNGRNKAKEFIHDILDLEEDQTYKDEIHGHKELSSVNTQGNGD